MTGALERIVEIPARLRDGAVVTAVEPKVIFDMVVERKQIVILKNAFSSELALSLRQAVYAWSRDNAPYARDDFRSNYHRRRAMVSNLQQAPHVFHDFNFNDFPSLPASPKLELLNLFEPLRLLYNSLTGYLIEFRIPAVGPYVHPQLIQYPRGGGFFARHWHNFVPQKVGFIVSLSRHAIDYPNGGTVFEIDGEVIDVEGYHDIGDICIWRYDYPHWVKQSDLKDKFRWESNDGRWVATFAHFDPYA